MASDWTSPLPSKAWPASLTSASIRTVRRPKGDQASIETAKLASGARPPGAIGPQVAVSSAWTVNGWGYASASPASLPR